MHNGALATLEEVMRHYERLAAGELQPLVGKLAFYVRYSKAHFGARGGGAADDVEVMVAFMQALTGTQRAARPEGCSRLGWGGAAMRTDPPGLYPYELRSVSILKDHRSLTGSSDANQVIGVISGHTIEDHSGTTIFCCCGNLHEFIGIAMCCIKTKTSSSIGNLEQVVYGHFPKAHRCFSYGEVGSACAYQPTIRCQVSISSLAFL